MTRLAALESLRGLLALWVVLGHVIALAYSEAQVAAVHLDVLYQPVLAVRVFMILSGFVIFYLLDNADLSYPAFVGRRFFRLAPLYFTVLATSALTLPMQIDALNALPWRDSSILTKIAVRSETIAHFWVHLVAHLSLLQSMVPGSVLKFSDYTFIGPAWSISLEWQFYLIAPVLFILVKARQWLPLGIVAVGFMILRYLNFAAEGFIGNHFDYFAIGIISYFVFRHGHKWQAMSARAAGFGALLATAILYSLLSSPWPLMAWSLVLPAITFGRNEKSGLLAATNWVLNNDVLKWLGKISYSIYLWHVPVLLAVTAAIEYVVPTFGRAFYLTVAGFGTLIITLAVSELSFRFIETPGIRFGKRFGGKPYPVLATNLAVPP